MAKGKQTKGVTWSEEHLQKLLAAGTIKGYKVIGGGRQLPADQAPAPDGKPKPARSRRNGKYDNQPQRVDGIYFPSIKEAKRWRDLKLLLLAGRIKDLRRQVSYELNPGGTFSYTYRADFVYVDTVTGEEIVEDAKGFRTEEFNKKCKLMLEIHGIEVRLV